jgi:hypothetical protein
VVIAVIGVIASIVLVNLKGTRERARIAKFRLFASSIYHSTPENIFYVNFENGYVDLAGNYDFDPAGSGGVIVDDKYFGKVFYQDWDSYARFTARSHFKEKSESGAFSIEGWIKPGPDYQVWLGTHSGNTYWYLAHLYSEFFFQIRTINSGTCRLECPDTDLVLPLRWNHIVGVYDGNGTIRLFINAEECSAGLVQSSCDGLLNLYGPIGIGGNSSQGYIDEVKIYYDVIPLATIQKHYTEGLERRELAEK